MEPLQESRESTVVVQTGNAEAVLASLFPALSSAFFLAQREPRQPSFSACSPLIAPRSFVETMRGDMDECRTLVEGVLSHVALHMSTLHESNASEAGWRVIRGFLALYELAVDRRADADDDVICPDAVDRRVSQLLARSDSPGSTRDILTRIRSCAHPRWKNSISVEQAADLFISFFFSEAFQEQQASNSSSSSNSSSTPHPRNEAEETPTTHTHTDDTLLRACRIRANIRIVTVVTMSSLAAPSAPSGDAQQHAGGVLCRRPMCHVDVDGPHLHCKGFTRVSVTSEHVPSATPGATGEQHVGEHMHVGMIALAAFPQLSVIFQSLMRGFHFENALLSLHEDVMAAVVRYQCDDGQYHDLAQHLLWLVNLARSAVHWGVVPQASSTRVLAAGGAHSFAAQQKIRASSNGSSSSSSRPDHVTSFASAAKRYRPSASGSEQQAVPLGYPVQGDWTPLHDEEEEPGVAGAGGGLSSQSQ
jgi:hypothetical protein